MRRYLTVLSLFLFATLQAADFYETLVVGGRVFQSVYVLSANESSLSIRHSKGISQLSLADLPAELQARYGFNASDAADRKQRLQEIRATQSAEAQSRLEARVDQVGKATSPAQGSGRLKQAFTQFGGSPRMEEELDLRPQFRAHGIGIRQQRGPSCSVHAIVAALEYQYAENEGKRINVSERILVAATSKTLGRKLRNELGEGQEIASSVDEGFALEHVFQAIRGYGLALDSRSSEAVPEAVAEEFRDVNFSPFQIPGGRTPTGIGNLIHVLNAKMPVVVGVAWPHDARVRNTSLLSQQPVLDGAGHAVTIVGYRCPTGKLEDTKFIFRNSWGADWGAGGYGFFSYEYLANNLFSAYVVELK